MNTPAGDSRWRLHSPAVVHISGVVTLAWFLMLLLSWVVIAGKSASPQPDNWHTLNRLLGVVEPGIVVFLVLLFGAPVARAAARRGERRARMFPIILAAACAVQILLCLWILATQRPPHIASQAKPMCHSCSSAPALSFPSLSA